MVFSCCFKLCLPLGFVLLLTPVQVVSERRGPCVLQTLRAMLVFFLLGSSLGQHFQNPEGPVAFWGS